MLGVEATLKCARLNRTEASGAGGQPPVPEVREIRLSMHATKPACTYVQALHIRHCRALRPQHAHQLLLPSLRLTGKRKWAELTVRDSVASDSTLYVDTLEQCQDTCHRPGLKTQTVPLYSKLTRRD